MNKWTDKNKNNSNNPFPRDRISFYPKGFPFIPKQEHLNSVLKSSYIDTAGSPLSRKTRPHLPLLPTPIPTGGTQAGGSWWHTMWPQTFDPHTLSSCLQTLQMTPADWGQVAKCLGSGAPALVAWPAPHLHASLLPPWFIPCTLVPWSIQSLAIFIDRGCRKIVYTF